MWKHLAKRASPRNFKLPSYSPSSTFIRFSQHSDFLEKIVPPQTQTRVNPRCPVSGFAQVGVFTSINELGRSNFLLSEYPFGFCPTLKLARTLTSVAEAIETIDTEEDYSVSNEVHDLLEQMMKEEEKGKQEQQKNVVAGVATYKDKILRRRQIKMETEAWEEAAKEYEELLEDMCEQKLVPNLPYMKSLFLGWFEPLRSAIVAEQEVCKGSNRRMTHAPYFNDLPAEMMAVITMHKLMGLLMTNRNGVGTARVIQAAVQVGEAIENEARIYRYLGQTKKKKEKGTTTEEPDGEFDHATTENGKLAEEKEKMVKEKNKIRNKVSSLIKKQKMQQAMGIIRGLDGWKPWGQEAQVKVGCRVMHLLIETAYIQPPVNQLGGGTPDIRPAFKHTFKTVTADSQRSGRTYGVIECDPLVQKGLEKTARHMVIPYMPMLVPPTNWTGYDKGAYLLLPTYVMRTHGAKQQREVVKRAPKNQLEPIYEALDTLGNTKWRINQRVFNVINQIWARGGRLGNLVDREDVPLPEEPDTEDEGEIRKWRWKVKAVKKENNERHSQRCDIELKLAVARKMKDEEGFYYPHNLDFRGRAYPMHPYLNHLGSDLCRGILEFAEGRPLGKSGLRWLKIHLANLYAGGVDKLCYEGRVAFTENHLDDVFDSANRPLEGRCWWLEAEDPFQCLAACINLCEALRSPTPETTISHVPVHQDGSCNGLQHYAALGRDKGLYMASYILGPPSIGIS